MNGMGSMPAGLLQQRFEYLHEALLYLRHSPRNQLVQIMRWFDVARRHRKPRQLHSYIRDIIGSINPLLAAIPPAGTPLDFFQRLRSDVDWLGREFPDLYQQADLGACQLHLHLRARTVMAYVGQPGEHSVGAPTWEKGSTPRDILQQHIRGIVQQGGRPEDELLAIADAWDAMSANVAGEAVVPLLEQATSHDAIDGFVPFVTFTRIRLHARMPARRDRSTDGNWLEIHGQASDGMQEQFRIIRRCIERLPQRYADRIELAGPVFSASFVGGTNTPEGRSFGLGMGMATVSALTDATLIAQTFIPSGRVTFTGVLDKDGSLVPLPETASWQKYEGVFFSPFDGLVLPSRNVHYVEKQRLALLDAWPHRKLDLYGIERMADALQYRSVMLIEQQNLITRVQRRWQRHQSVIAAAAAILMLFVVVSYFVFIADFDANPRQVTMEGNAYVVRNTSGKPLWSTPRRKNATTSPQSSAAEPFFRTSPTVVYDLDGDGRNEVIIGHPEPEAGFSDSVYCFHHDGTRRWSAPVGLGIRTLEGEYLTRGDERVSAVVVIPASAHRGCRIIVTCSNGYYTNLVHAFDADGREKGRYLHLGGLELPVLMTDPHDNRPVLVCGGTLNGYRRPILVVLDPYDLSGVSPQKATHRLLEPKLPAARELHYVLFPDVDLAPYSELLFNPNARVVQADNRGIRVDAAYATAPIGSSDRQDFAYLTFVLDPRTMEVRDVNTSTQYDVLHARLRSTGLVTAAIDSAYKNDIIRRVEYWNGTHFVTRPRELR